jgi:hypothetical protein
MPPLPQEDHRSDQIESIVMATKVADFSVSRSQSVPLRISLPAGSRKPTYRLVPDSDGSRGPEAARLVAKAGLKLDPWQRDVLVAGMATLNGSWAADEVCTVVPRQNGKTLGLVARALWGPTLGGERLVLFTSHQFKSCREAFLLAKSLCETAAFEAFEPRVSVSHGKEGITFADGSRLLFHRQEPNLRQRLLSGLRDPR